MEELYRVHRVARLLDCTRKQVYRLIREGEIKALKMGPRQTRVIRSSLEKYIRKHQEQYKRERC